MSKTWNSGGRYSFSISLAFLGVVTFPFLELLYLQQFLASHYGPVFLDYFQLFLDLILSSL